MHFARILHRMWSGLRLDCKTCSPDDSANLAPYILDCNFQTAPSPPPAAFRGLSLRDSRHRGGETSFTVASATGRTLLNESCIISRWSSRWSREDSALPRLLKPALASTRRNARDAAGRCIERGRLPINPAMRWELLAGITRKAFRELADSVN